MHGLVIIKLPCVARKSFNGHGILSLLKLQVEQDRKKRKRKENVTPAARHRRERGPVGLMMITVTQDAT